MRVLCRLFTFACKEGKDRAIAVSSLLAGNSSVNCIFSKTADSVIFEVSRRGFVLGVLKATDTACAHLALLSSACKEVARSAVIIL